MIISEFLRRFSVFHKFYINITKVQKSKHQGIVIKNIIKDKNVFYYFFDLHLSQIIQIMIK